MTSSRNNRLQYLPRTALAWSQSYSECKSSRLLSGFGFHVSSFHIPHDDSTPHGTRQENPTEDATRHGTKRSGPRIGCHEIVEFAEAVADVALVMTKELLEAIGMSVARLRQQFGHDRIEQFRRRRAVDQGGQPAGTMDRDDQARRMSEDVASEKWPHDAADGIGAVEQDNFIAL